MQNTFGKEIIPSNDEQRLNTLKRYQLLQSVPDGYFSSLAHIIATTFDVPIALISLVDKESVHFLGNAGMEDTHQTPRGISLCSLAILDNKPTIFNDALNEPCLLTNPLVSGSFGLRFYAGVPINTNDGFNIGTVCVIDKEPREFGEKEKQMLQQFSKSVLNDLEVRRNTLINL